LLPWAEVLVETPKLVLVGPQNAGKSSLFNEWVQEDRCTVSPHPGTTRDAVEATILLGSGFDAFAVNLIDTAGFGSAADLIDSAAQKITHGYLQDAWRVVWLFDQNLEPSDELLELALMAEHGLVFLNHADGEGGWNAPDDWPRISLLDNPAGAMRVVKETICRSLPALPQLGCSLPRDCTELLRMQELS
jgi:tRNA U34 5-carboxymethylaminomethyl modifying GTPase MnmE/TrmE